MVSGRKHMHPWHFTIPFPISIIPASHNSSLDTAVWDGRIVVTIVVIVVGVSNSWQEQQQKPIPCVCWLIPSIHIAPWRPLRFQIVSISFRGGSEPGARAKASIDHPVPFSLKDWRNSPYYWLATSNWKIRASSLIIIFVQQNPR